MNLLRLVPERGGPIIEIDQDQVRLGRDRGSDIHLPDASISRQHADIMRSGEDWIIVDLDSGNGVLVDGVRTQEALLLPGQRLQLGNLRFRVDIDKGDDGATVIFGRPPLEDSDRTLVQGGGTRPARSPRIAAVSAGILALTAAGLAVGFYMLSSRPEPAHAARPLGPALPITTPSMSETSTSLVAPVVREAPPVSAPPRSVILISTEIRADVWVDGQFKAAIPASGLRRTEVSPGEHIVSFRIGEARHDRLVRTTANEQSVVRFSGESTSPTVGEVRAAEVVGATRPPLAGAERVEAAPAAVLTPVAIPTPALPTSPAPAPTATPALQPTRLPEVNRPSDAGLLKGAAENDRSDFYRALLTLKDVARRLEKNPLATRDLALALAHLAWAYHGLDREADAQAAADRALSVDPNILVSPATFPADIVGLFNARRAIVR